MVVRIMLLNEASRFFDPVNIFGNIKSVFAVRVCFVLVGKPFMSENP